MQAESGVFVFDATDVPGVPPMATARIRRLYKAYRLERSKGFRAAEAYHNADTRDVWEEVEARGMVALRIVPDEDPDTSTWDRQEHEEAERDGVWGIVGEHRCCCCGQWVVADSVWGFTGDSWRDSGYDTDVMVSVLRQRFDDDFRCGRPCRG